MAGKAFLDTNVILYAHDTREPAKREVALALYRRVLSDDTLVVSTAILGEVYYNLVRKKIRPAELARKLIEGLAEGACYVLAPGDFVHAADVSQKHRLGFFDSLHLVAAAKGGAERFYSEDLNHGQVVEGVEILNPFK